VFGVPYGGVLVKLTGVLVWVLIAPADGCLEACFRARFRVVGRWRRNLNLQHRLLVRGLEPSVGVGEVIPASTTGLI
jgi:hypothetical protein